MGMVLELLPLVAADAKGDGEGGRGAGGEVGL